jgi:hypothetical protein
MNLNQYDNIIIYYVHLHYVSRLTMVSLSLLVIGVYQHFRLQVQGSDILLYVLQQSTMIDPAKK